MSGLPGRLAPRAKAVIFPRSRLKITSRLSYSPTGEDFKTIPATDTCSLMPVPFSLLSRAGLFPGIRDRIRYPSCYSRNFSYKARNPAIPCGP